MGDRILDVSERPAWLRVRSDQLLVDRDESGQASIPLCDLAVVVLGHPQVVVTKAALAGLARHGGVVLVCDEKHLPAAMMLPLDNHTLQAERFAAQAAAGRPLRKRLWRQIVRSKIAAQAELLFQRRGEDFGLRRLIPLVRSGDPANVEARAAARYWNRLFGDEPFRRARDANDQNRLLNYGYAVLRALTARAICAAGLHPSLGLHHHNRYDVFCLASDLMEPFRVLVDQVVAEDFAEEAGEWELVPKTKARILGALLGRCRSGGEQRTLFDVLARLCTSLASCYLGEKSRLELPESVVHAAK